MDLVLIILAVLLVLLLWPVLKAFGLIILVIVVIWFISRNNGRRL